MNKALLIKTLCILVHGFNVTDGGAGSIGKLVQYLENRGADTLMIRYGWYGLIQTRFCNDEVAETLASIIDYKAKKYDRIIVIGHSNGCSIAHLASHICEYPVDRFVYINPALRKNLAPACRVKQCDVWHNRYDGAVLWSKLLFWVASERPWGVMGNTGYQGNDKRMFNFDTVNDFSHVAKGHSAVFEDRHIPFYGPLIAATSLRANSLEVSP